MYISVLVNAEPVNIGRDGADEPPTLIKEDLLSSGGVSQGPSGTQVPFMKTTSAKMENDNIVLHGNNLAVLFDRRGRRSQEPPL